MNKTMIKPTSAQRIIQAFMRPAVATAIATTLVVGCGAGSDTNSGEASAGTSVEALAGTVAFGETAVAPPVTFSGSRVRAIHRPFAQNVVYVGGNFTVTYNGQSYSNLVKFTIPSTAGAPLVFEPSFRPTPNGAVWAIAATTSKVYVGGSFTKFGTTTRTGLASVNATDGTLDTAFTANVEMTKGSCVTACGSSPPENASHGVHALVWEDLHDTRGSDSTKVLVVGGNFVSINDKPRSGLAAVSPTNGAVYDNYFRTGVNGFVSSLKLDGNFVYVGGYFNSPRIGLMRTDIKGSVSSATYAVGGNVVSLDVDTTSRVIAGTQGNAVMAFPTTGSTDAVPYLWSYGVAGDVQAVKCHLNNVYFGFHDGMFRDGGGSVTGDQYKLAALNVYDGTLLRDKRNLGACNGDTPDYCWAPEADPANQSIGIWGVFAIDSISDSNGGRLFVGGDVNKWGKVSSKLFTSFNP